MKPIVAIVGRPNVGKSTLFNRITKKRDAIVDDIPGVTRDSHYADAKWDDIEFTLIDTGGFIEKDGDAFSDDIKILVKQAVEESDVIIALFDGKNGLSPFDFDIANMLRGASKPIFFVVNKIDCFKHEDNIYDYHQLGIEKLYSISAEHGHGIYDLLDEIIKTFPLDNYKESDEYENIIKIAIVGRPNVGKSSIVNKILNKKRMLVSDIPGTTRDSIDSLFEIDGQKYLLIDTAGIRKKSKVSEKLEKFSIIKALTSLERCHIALIVLDAEQGVSDQDIKIAGYAFERGRACIFLINKWDLIEKDGKAEKEFFEKIRYEAKFLQFAPMLTVSALTGKRILKIFPVVNEIYKQYSTRISTSQVNKIFEHALESTQPPMVKGKRIKVYFSSQTSVKPPTFVCFSNYPESIHFSYERYLVNQIREQSGLDKTPIRIFFRQRTSNKT
ncbi:MAG: ribosome biogenesis GTPase Der [Desulfobacterales bacterium]|nr:ribosome biogenesis GTPase Der [Desulfobacterales bacterium]